MSWRLLIPDLVLRSSNRLVSTSDLSKKKLWTNPICLWIWGGPKNYGQIRFEHDACAHFGLVQNSGEGGGDKNYGSPDNFQILMFSKHSLTPTKASSGPLLYKITPSKVASHSQSNASVSEGLRMLDLSQFKRSEEEVRAQIEAKQALMSEIIEEKVKQKV